MSDDYLSKFINQDEIESEKEERELPAWVDAKNSSKKAFEAIVALSKTKREYIHRHSKQSMFTKKSNYLISRAEVARIVGVNAQPLFNNVSYSRDISKLLEEENSKLEDLKSRKVMRNRGGLRQKKKNELVKELQSQKQDNEALLKSMVDSLYQRTLENLSLDVKKKLKLDD